MDADSSEICELLIWKYKDSFNLTELFTHLCVADTKSEKIFTEEQIEKYKSVAEFVKGLPLPYIHCMNSVRDLWCDSYGKIARLGIILYSLKPDYSNKLPEGIESVLEWKAVVSIIRTVHTGGTIEYGRSFKAEKNMKIAMIPIGYADGDNYLLSNKGCVLIKDRNPFIVGRGCMD